MEDLKIQFSHPVKGRIQLRRKTAGSMVKTLNFKSDKHFTVDVDVQHLNDGNWIASLEWEYNNQPFLMQRHFKIVDKKFIQ